MPERRWPPPPIVIADLKAFVSPFVQRPINGLMANAHRRRDVLHFETRVQRQSRYLLLRFVRHMATVFSAHRILALGRRFRL